ncbi:MAG TPA: CpsB/CapC family capsule biosynthesis tyrosine phosphatase [Phycisphaerae bacterium]|nr:CpsB/CapC family capsule biosynthesis tyrosine phosphatase [Phycisphaerae bacterium]
MPTGRIDVHAHLLPGIDDGCHTLDDSLRCARTYVEHGYSHVCCTPHVWPSLQENTVANIRRRTIALQQELQNAGIPLTLIPGGEINLEWNWPAIREKKTDEIVTYGLSGAYVLFDFWADVMPDFLGPATAHLQSLGLKLIMAHPERIKAIQGDPASTDRFIEQGILLQCNTWCLREPVGTPIRTISERLLRAGKYHLLGTDLHEPATMPPRMEGLRMAIDMIGEEAVSRLTIENPRRLIANIDHPLTPQPAPH